MASSIDPLPAVPTKVALSTWPNRAFLALSDSSGIYSSGVITPEAVVILELRDRWQQLYVLRSATGRGQYLSSKSTVRGGVLSSSLTAGNDEVFKITPATSGPGYTIQAVCGGFVSTVQGGAAMVVVPAAAAKPPLVWSIIVEPVVGGTSVPYALQALRDRRVCLWSDCTGAWVTMRELAAVVEARVVLRRAGKRVHVAVWPTGIHASTQLHFLQGPPHGCNDSSYDPTARLCFPQTLPVMAR